MRQQTHTPLAALLASQWLARWLRKHPCWLIVGSPATESQKLVGGSQNDTLAIVH